MGLLLCTTTAQANSSEDIMTGAETLNNQMVTTEAGKALGITGGNLDLLREVLAVTSTTSTYGSSLSCAPGQPNGNLASFLKSDADNPGGLASNAFYILAGGSFYASYYPMVPLVQAGTTATV